MFAQKYNLFLAESQKNGRLDAFLTKEKNEVNVFYMHKDKSVTYKLIRPVKEHKEKSSIEEGRIFEIGVCYSHYQ
ncbi:hypothetical protein ABE48_07125 [Bacillus thuringiensis]|uniref:hypothetical protein n=1 Tax=Bacillus cereus group TaxID=86661 RepID=UPI000F89F6AE|nr:hypothetical protein [Bacillus thuringiensis]AZR80705.1 hypothetical protein BtSCAC15_31750 [Bacillus thuringiensis]MBG9523564.1 hypothetical protein [Bacillus thuringiensis]MBG9530931.1 hypothetical protein [Bacillus thuringiensis]